MAAAARVPVLAPRPQGEVTERPKPLPMKSRIRESPAAATAPANTALQDTAPASATAGGAMGSLTAWERSWLSECLRVPSCVRLSIVMIPWNCALRDTPSPGTSRLCAASRCLSGHPSFTYTFLAPGNYLGAGRVLLLVESRSKIFPRHPSIHNKRDGYGQGLGS